MAEAFLSQDRIRILETVLQIDNLKDNSNENIKIPIGFNHLRRLHPYSLLRDGI